MKETREFNLEFVGIDFWSRPIFKQEDKEIYFGSTISLFPDREKNPDNTEEGVITYFKDNPEEIEFFGSSFGCEPHGGRADNWKYKFKDRNTYD